MNKRILKIGKILFKLCQMLHIPSCMLLFYLISIFLYKHQIMLYQSIGYAIPFTLEAMGCFAINDYYDYEKDVINKPYRILPLKLISRVSALRIGYFLFSLSVVTAIIVSQNIYELLIYILVATAAFIYGRFINNIGVIKSIYTSIVIAVPLLFAVYKTQLQVNSLFLFWFVVFYITGKELIMDIYDIKGDKEAGQHTIPIIFGEKKTFCIAIIMQFVSLLLCFFKLGITFEILMLCYIFLAVCYFFWFQNYRTWRRFVIYCLWIPLVVCIIIII